MTDAAVHDQRFEDYLEEIRALTDEVLIPAEERMQREGAVPEDVMEQIRAHGLYGISVPREYGGGARSMLEQVLLTFEFTRASVVYRSRFSTVIGLCSQAILDHGSAEQKRSLLPRMVTGECVTAFALTEENAGSDARAVQAALTDTGTGFVLNGGKRFITNGAWADLYLVFARDDARGGMTTVLVPADAPGVSSEAAQTMNGHEAGAVGSIDFASVAVPYEAVLGERGSGLRAALRGINHARTHVAATCVGQGERLLRELGRFADERQQFGQRLADMGAIQSLIGRGYAEMAAARALVLECAGRFDAGHIDGDAISAAKYFASEAVGRLADSAVQILGGEGIVGDGPVPRIWRDVRALRIYEGTSQIHERNLTRRVVARAKEDDAVLSPARD